MLLPDLLHSQLFDFPHCAHHCRSMLGGWQPDHACPLIPQANAEDRLPSWARNQQRGGAASNGPQVVVPTGVPRRRGSAATTTTSTAAAASNGRPGGPTRADSGKRGSAAAAAGGPGAGRAAGGGDEKGLRGKSEYLGPDGDIAANLERDMLDRSPGVK